MESSGTDLFFKISGTVGAVFSVLGGIIIKDIYSRINRLESSNGAILSQLSTNSQDIVNKIHSMEMKFSDTLHHEMGAAVKSMIDMQEMARQTFHTKDEHRQMTQQTNEKIDFGMKTLQARIENIMLTLSMLDTEEARSSRASARKYAAKRVKDDL